MQANARDSRRRGVVALCGGVGGAKLALGLYRLLPPDSLTLVVNTGDDFNHLGLHVSPDLDTVTYTLAGLADAARGWGRSEETWGFVSELERLGGPAWFQLGDRDLALHVWRSFRLRSGQSLSAFTGQISARLAIRARVLPMTDDAVQTKVETDEGILAFQEYFVARRCRPRLRSVLFEGAGTARANPEALEAIRSDETAAIVICPSNPYLSIDPILALPGMRAAIAHASAPVVAVSPTVGGRAVKGPTAKIMQEMGKAACPLTIAEHYQDLIDGLVIDEADRHDLPGGGAECLLTATVMESLGDRVRLAREVCEFADALQALRLVEAG